VALSQTNVHVINLPMQKIIFASNNRNKAEEIKAVLGAGWTIITLAEAGIEVDIPEPHDTLEENAREKSMTIFNITHEDCFSEDTGLETEALNGEPGVKSARYAGDDRSTKKNIEKLLHDLNGKDNRKAKFRTVISLIREGTEHQFTGVCTGAIAHQPRGKDGFGYDPVFIPDGETRTFAEMTLEEKNHYSHRRKAIDQLIYFLQNNPIN
jgi:XTP/dITP diphosphohydrolase